MPVLAWAATIAALAAGVGFVTSAALAAPPKLVRRPCPKASVVGSILGQPVSKPVKQIVVGIETCTYSGTGRHAQALATIAFQAVTPAEFFSSERGAARTTPGGITKLRGIGQGGWETNTAIFVRDGTQEVSVQAPTLTAVQPPAKVMAKLRALVRAILASRS